MGIAVELVLFTPNSPLTGFPTLYYFHEARGHFRLPSCLGRFALKASPTRHYPISTKLALDNRKRYSDELITHQWGYRNYQ